MPLHEVKTILYFKMCCLFTQIKFFWKVCLYYYKIIAKVIVIVAKVHHGIIDQEPVAKLIPH